MSQPHFEVAGGAIDGVNTTFTTSLPYTPGTLAVFLNGQLLRTVEWAETSPSSRLFMLSQPPFPPDMVQVFYLDAVPGQVGVEITPITGVINPIDDIQGALLDLSGIQGVVNNVPEPVLGSVQSLQAIQAQLQDVTPLVGVLEVC